MIHFTDACRFIFQNVNHDSCVGILSLGQHVIEIEIGTVAHHRRLASRIPELSATEEQALARHDKAIDIITDETIIKITIGVFLRTRAKAEFITIHRSLFVILKGDDIHIVDFK